MSFAKSGLLAAVILLAGCSSTRTRQDRAPAPEARAPVGSAESAPVAHGNLPVEKPDLVQSAPATAAKASQSMQSEQTEPVADKASTSPMMQSEGKQKPETSQAPNTKPVARHTAGKSEAVTVATHAKHKKPAHKVLPKPTPPSKPVALPARLPITGTVRLSAGRGQSVSASDYANTVIYFVPKSRNARPSPGKFTIYTHNRDFNPAWLVVPIGSTVTFTNLDTIKHNVFSVTSGAQFNLGYQSSGESVTHTFSNPGLVLLSCNVHRAMRGDVLVVPTRYAAIPDANGNFSISGAPAEPGTLYFWNPRSRNSSQATRPPFANIRQSLPLGRPAVTTKVGIRSH